eukprot:COSAG06_NODE_5397_length_3506_cov_144.148518_2_plen_174_part_00
MTTECLSALLPPAALSPHLCPACLLVLDVVPCSWTYWSLETLSPPANPRARTAWPRGCPRRGPLVACLPDGPACLAGCALQPTGTCRWRPGRRTAAAPFRRLTDLRLYFAPCCDPADLGWPCWMRPAHAWVGPVMPLRSMRGFVKPPSVARWLSRRSEETQTPTPRSEAPPRR